MTADSQSTSTASKQNRRMKKLLRQIAGSKFTRDSASAFTALIEIQEAAAALLAEMDAKEWTSDDAG
jgi:hypothetical protein